MSLQQYLYQTFKFSRKLRQNNYSIFVVQDIKDILYGEGSNVFGAAFGTDRAYRHFTVDMAIPAFDLLADEILFYLSNKKVETVKSFDEWHHKTCEMFLNKLNQTITETNYPEQKLYGKAQKVL